MKNYTILKWCHFAINFLPRILKLKESQVFTKTIEFTDSCRYSIDEASCVNKLFGFSFGLCGVHKNSARYGWTYDKTSDSIVIWKYVYADGDLTKHTITDVKIGEKTKFDIDCQAFDGHTYRVIFYINNKWMDSFWFTTKRKWLLTLGYYFGGNTRAPHTMHVNLY